MSGTLFSGECLEYNVFIRRWLARFPIMISVISSIVFFLVSSLGLCIGISPMIGSENVIIKEVCNHSEMRRFSNWIAIYLRNNYR